MAELAAEMSDRAGVTELIEPDLLLVEAAIVRCVRDFYAAARRDPLLGPIFEAQVHDWDVHLRVVANFWSSALLGTQRYSGHPYVVHVGLPIEPQHIERWLELFTDTVRATVPPPYAELALARARMMGDSFKVGLFPFVDKDGKPARRPA
jgi:hemoglobin